MFNFTKQKLTFRNKFIKQVFSRRPWIILIIALVIFAAFTTAIVYEQYVMNQDNLAQYLPADTVFYLHSNTMTSSLANRSFKKFLDYHPRFYAKLKEYVAQNTESVWPHLNNISHQEIAYAVVPVGDEWVPTLLLFVSDEKELLKSAEFWQELGWQVNIQDNIIMVSKVSYELWRPLTKNLAQTLKSKKIPLANQLYFYVNLTNHNAWAKNITSDPVILELLNQWSQTQDYQVVYITMRNDALLFTEDLATFSDSRMVWQQKWIDSVPAQDMLLLRNIDPRLLFSYLQSQSDFLTAYGFDITKLIKTAQNKYDYDLLNDLILNITDQADLAILWNSESDQLVRQYIFGFETTAEFDLNTWNDFLRLALAYKYPDQVEVELNDGSKIIEQRAHLYDGIQVINTGKFNDYDIYQVMASDQPGDWVYALRGKEIIVANDIVLLEQLLKNNFAKPATEPVCENLSNSYIKFNPPQDLAEVLGLEDVVINMKDNKYAVCIQ